MRRADWTPLRAALARMRDAGLRVPLWWRDDDATDASPALTRLADLADAVAVPVHLATVPANALPVLAGIAAKRRFVPVVHGWAHVSHAPAHEKKAEFGAHRPLPVLVGEARAGLTRLRGIFGADCAPMFVPPWNRISPDLAAQLPAAGFASLSTFGPRARADQGGVALINTHVDPIDWRGHRGLRDPADLIAATVARLDARRAGHEDATEPLGLLTHHLVHDDAIWDFTAGWLDEMKQGPVDIWTHPTGEPPP
ncbi:MAG: polysaccharide deacetylase family protein [Rhodobacteraceae bacterium]|nr:polysaccharide deacetylase family protein [Paracoccaceae bacterium]